MDRAEVTVFCQAKVPLMNQYCLFTCTDERLGADASRAFVTGCFKTHLTHDIRGLDEKGMQTLEGWHDFFVKSDK